MKKIKRANFILVPMLCACLYFSFINADSREPRPLKVYSAGGIKVDAYDYEGLQYFLNRKNDTTYIVNFWATWCVPCVKELPAFEGLAQKYKGEKVKVLLVSLDMPKMVESKLLPFITDKKIKSRVLLMRDPDANNWISKVDAKWSGAIPATLIYNRNKRQFYERSFTAKELEKELAKIRKV